MLQRGHEITLHNLHVMEHCRNPTISFQHTCDECPGYMCFWSASKSMNVLSLTKLPAMYRPKQSLCQHILLQEYKDDTWYQFYDISFKIRIRAFK